MTKKIVKVFSILLALLLLVYVGFQAYMILYPTYTTEVAMISAVDDSIAATGIVVRDETVIDSSAPGVRSYLVSNGDKVAKDSYVADIYATPQDAIDHLTLQWLKSELDILHRTADGGRTAGTNMESLTFRIQQQLADITTQADSGSFSDITKSKQQLLDLMNSYNIASGQPQSFDARIADLEAQIQALEQKNIAPTGHVETPVEGYFISSVDGMENVLNKTNVKDMSVEQLAAYVKGEQVSINTDACKVVSDYTWYYAAIIDDKHESRFAPGTQLMLDFNYAAATSVPASVVSVTTDAALHKTVVLLECSILNASIADLRCENAQLSFRNYSGFIVDRSALHMYEGELGVFIKSGSVVAFRKVDVIYETNSYIVSRANTGDAEYLRLYDEILVSGKDLSVGKSLAG